MLDRIKWTSFGGFIVGVGMLIVAAVRSDAGWLVAAVFVLLVSLFGGKLQELVANKDGFRALFFPDYAKEVAKQLPARPEPAQLPSSGDTRVLERTATDEVKVTDSVDAKVTPGTATGSGSANAAAATVRPEDVAESKDEKELARRVIDYLQQSTGQTGRQLPALRGLSPQRIKAEQDLFGAILELQTDRHRSADLGTEDAHERAIQSEIVRWWNAPASLDDEEVADLARRVRDLIDYRMKRG